MSRLSPEEYESAIQSFRDEVAKCTSKTPDPPVSCGRSYVRMSKLNEWWRSPTPFRDNSRNITQASRLIQYAYRKGDKRHVIPMRTDRLFGNDTCIIVFSILLQIDWGDLIHLFLYFNKCDKHLPFDNIESICELLRKISGMQGQIRQIPDTRKLAEAFFKEQWRFCPIRFNVNYNHFTSHHIIPIHRKERITEKGGTANLWQIEVLKEFVDEKLQDVAKTSEYTPDDDLDNFGARYHFALKSFNEGNQKLCENETNAFTALESHGGMVRYLGGYTHQQVCDPSDRDLTSSGQQKTKETYNILLEYGERDLDDKFFYHHPPVVHREIEAFWKSLSQVADAVKKIHNWKIDYDGITQEYYGWHADIKPDNILEIGGKFKLADPGFATFLEKDTGKSTDNPTANMPGGTYSFGAPELHPGRRGSGEANQTIDVWSLGCVFSVAATWIALGYQGVRQYRELRFEATSKRVKTQQTQPTLHPQGPKLDHGDYFHDGLCVLPEVIRWHKFLRSHLRKSDNITNQILDLVDDNMLIGNPQLRMKSSNVCEALANIQKDVATFPAPSVHPSILQFLKELDERIPTLGANSPYTNSVLPLAPSHATFEDRQRRKSQYSRAPLIPTTHRSYLNTGMPAKEVVGSSCPPILEATTEIAALPSPSPQSQSNIVSSPDLNAGSKQEPQLTERHSSPLKSFAPTPESITDFPDTASRPSSNPIENKSHPRGAVEWGLKRTMTSIFSSKNKKDQFLARYYGNRDIVFLVDNADSMSKHWPDAKRLLETLVLKVQGLDEDGVDLLFTQGSASARNIKVRGTHKIRIAMDLEEAVPTPGISTDIIPRLQEMFDEYLQEVRSKYRSDRSVKRRTIIVLTDGIWDSTMDKDGVSRIIVNCVKNLQIIMQRVLEDRPFSIEFVQFGDDADAKDRLKKLDDELKQQNIPDVVDTEPSTGDVNKMLLGSFVPLFDEKEEDENLLSLDNSSPNSHPSVTKSHNERRSTYNRLSTMFSPSTNTPSPPQRSRTISSPGHHFN